MHCALPWEGGRILDAICSMCRVAAAHQAVGAAADHIPAQARKSPRGQRGAADQPAEGVWPGA